MYFTYDPHGNVEWLVQDINGFKNYIAYEYDLVSGNVLKVKYNEGKKEQFFHRYSYDADNRIVLTETSKDNKLWDRDARYEYYDHGPLKRTLIGEDKVQGLDYVYTIQGWLKAMNNAAAVGSGSEQGNVGGDAFAMTLAYYSGDFVRSGSPYLSTASAHLQGRDLFNGNISSWTSNMDFLSTDTIGIKYPQLTGETYRYDELNRITQSHFQYFNSGWNPVTDYQTGYRYDANGNILGLLRNGFATDMDSLRYNYISNSNKLEYVDDNVTSSNYDTDIDDQAAGNYGYDETGNMIKDEAEEIDTIEWTVYGKVKKIIRDGASSKPDLEFVYDAAGNRVMKIVKPNPADSSGWTWTYYMRDPSGNIMSIYEATADTAITGDTMTYVMKEQPIYGSSRIGERKEDITVFKTAGSSELPLEGITNLTELSYMALLQQGSGFVRERDLYLTTGSAALLDTITRSGNTLPGRNICVAEDENANKLFSVITHKKLQGVNNACVVYDRNGSLMTGLTGISSDWQGKALAMKKPGSSNEYYLFTVGTNGTPYYHIIDMSGNGGLGTVSTINQTLVSATNYGRGMALVENQTAGARSYLYLRNYSSGNANIVSIEITAAGFGTPQTLATFASNDTKGSGEMQISVDKTKFAVANKKGNKKGFFNVSTGEIRIYDAVVGSSLTLDTALSLGNQHTTSTLDFSPQGTYLFYGLMNLVTPQTVPPKGGSATALWRYELATGTKENVTNFGEVRRGKNGKMYVALQNNQNLKEVSTPDGSYTVADFAAAITGEKLAGVLPLQPNRTLPEVDDSLFVRELAKKVYSINDHLSSSRILLTDRKLSTISGGMPTAFTGQILEYYNYAPGGFVQVGRKKQSATPFRFTYGSHERVDEVLQNENTVDMGDRWLDTRILRTPKPDKFSKLLPHLSPYSYAANNPIYYIDDEGKILIGVDQKSALRMQQTLIASLGEKFVKENIVLHEDGTFSTRDKYKYNIALRGLKDPNQQALARGVFKAINSKYKIKVQVTDDEENISKAMGGGIFVPEEKKSGTAFIYENNTTPEQTNKGEEVPSVDEIIIHEVIGEGVNACETGDCGEQVNLESTQTSNIQRRIEGKKTYRTGSDHKVGEKQEGKVQEIPKALQSIEKVE